MPASPSNQRFFVSLVIFVALLAGIWLGFYALWASLPYTKAGHEQIYDLQLGTVDEGVVFPAGEPVRLVIFGNSRVLSGFKPDLFDSLSGGSVYSYNLGLPAKIHYLDELRTLVARGQAPTHVFLTLLQSVSEPPGAWKRLQQDSELIGKVFPFRHAPRDLAIFLMRSLGQGGPVQYYRHAAGYVEQAAGDRGYFFIEGMSHFPGHRLPDDFELDTDDDSLAVSREAGTHVALLGQLEQLARDADMRLYFVPLYHRERSFAPAPSNEEARRYFARFGIETLGPDYWLYPNALFSDPIHLNREGAEVYTRGLWDLFAAELEATRQVSNQGEAR